jgi:hypothetical protein
MKTTFRCFLADAVSALNLLAEQVTFIPEALSLVLDQPDGHEFRLLHPTYPFNLLPKASY